MNSKYTGAQVESILDNAYTKPSGGIPKTDLASAVQTSLGKADTALQSGDVYSKSEIDTMIGNVETLLASL